VSGGGTRTGECRPVVHTTRDVQAAHNSPPSTARLILPPHRHYHRRCLRSRGAKVHRGLFVPYQEVGPHGFGHSQDGVVPGGIQHGGLVDVGDVVHDIALHSKHIPAGAMRRSVRGVSSRIGSRS